MNRSIFSVVFVSIFLLSACTGMDGMTGQADGPNSDMPQGYGVINQEGEGLRPVFKPGRLMTGPEMPVVESHDLTWQKLDNYDGTTAFVPDQPQKIMPEKAISGTDYDDSGSVVVFPLEGAIADLDYEAPVGMSSSDDLPLSIVSSSGVELVNGGAGYNYYPLNGEIASAIYFGYGSASLVRADRARLADMARGLGERGIIHVTGHASKRVDGVNDPVLRRIINLKMSMKRAEAVSAELFRAGIAPERVETLGLGDTRPNGSLGGKKQEDADRRVEIYLGR